MSQLRKRGVLLPSTQIFGRREFKFKLTVTNPVAAIGTAKVATSNAHRLILPGKIKTNIQKK